MPSSQMLDTSQFMGAVSATQAKPSLNDATQGAKDVTHFEESKSFDAVLDQQIQSDKGSEKTQDVIANDAYRQDDPTPDQQSDHHQTTDQNQSQTDSETEDHVIEEQTTSEDPQQNTEETDHAESDQDQAAEPEKPVEKPQETSDQKKTEAKPVLQADTKKAEVNDFRAKSDETQKNVKVIQVTKEDGQTKTVRLDFDSSRIDALLGKLNGDKEGIRPEEAKKIFDKVSADLIKLQKLADQPNFASVRAKVNVSQTNNTSDEPKIKAAKSKKFVDVDALVKQSQATKSNQTESQQVTQVTAIKVDPRLVDQSFDAESKLAKGKAGQNGNTVAVSFDRAFEKLQQSSKPQFGRVATPQQVTQQFLDAAKVQLSQDKTEMSIRLKPDYLGEIHMKVQMQSTGAGKSSIMVAAIEVDSSAVKDILQSNLSSLRSSLEENNGILIKKFDIFVRQELPDQAQQDQQASGKQNKKGSGQSFSDFLEGSAEEFETVQLTEAQKVKVEDSYTWLA